MAKSEVKIGALLSYVTIALNTIIGIFYTPFLTHMLGQSEYGLYSLVSSIISYITVLDFGFGNAIVVYTSKFLAKNDKAEEEKLHGMFLIIYIFIGIIAGIIGLFLYLNVETLFSNSMTLEEINTGKTLMAILTFNLVITFPFSIFTNIITAYEKFVFSKCLNIIRVLALPLCMTPLLLFGYKSISLVIVTTVINVGVLATNTLYCIFRLKLSIKFRGFNIPLLKEIFFYSFFIFLNIIVERANWEIDKLILGVVCGTSSVAVYAVSSQFHMIYEGFSTGINSVLLPKIAKMEASGASDKYFSDIFIITGRLQYLIMGLVLSGFVLFGYQFTIYLFGEDYKDAYIISLITLIPATIPLIQNMGLNIMQAKNKYWFRSLVYVFIAILNVCLSFWLAHYYGGIGAATGTSAAITLGNVLIINIYYKIKIKINISQFWKEIGKMTIPILICMLLTGCVIYFSDSQNVILYVLEILLYVLLYCVAMYLFAMNDYEKDLIKRMLKR